MGDTAAYNPWAAPVFPQQESFQPTIDAVGQQYPALKPYADNLIVQRGTTTDPNDDRQLEFYQPWSKDNPNPGQLTSEIYNPNLKGQDLTETVGGDLLHHLGAVDPRTGQPIDPKWAAMKQEFVAGMGPDQHRMNVDAYGRELANPSYETEPYSDWMQHNRSDAYIRGALFPSQNPNWQQEGIYTPAMRATASKMRDYLGGKR